jgi:putative ATP-binding cassette transporter
MDNKDTRLFGATYTNRQLFKGFWKLGKPYWFSEEKWPARGLLTLVILLTLGWVYLMVLVNTWYRNFYNAIQQFNEKIFWSLLGYFGILAAFAILISVFRQYFTQTLQNRWRKWMTRKFLEQWLQDKSHYLWQLGEKKTDNPDQRISEDIRDFVNYSLTLSVGLLNQVVTFFSFISILWILSGPLHIPLGHGQYFSVPGYMAWACLIYAGISTWIAHRIGRPLIGFNYNQQLLEADFRFSLVRLRENGESVALSDGENVEEASLKNSFQWVFFNFKSIIRKTMHLNFFSSGYDQLAIVFPLMVAAPRYFAKQIGYGGLIQVTNSFDQVRRALSWILDNYATLAYWRSVVERLEGFEYEVDRTKQMRIQAQSVVQHEPNQGAIRLDQVTLLLPGNAKPLLNSLDMQFQEGKYTLILGPSGCGKSTLFRTIYGIWPYAKGKVYLPANAKIMIVPQKPYLPVGTLRATLTYPKSELEFSDHEIKEVLALCSLSHLEHRLDESANWALMLSGGEQQRVIWGRIFLHQPQWIFMDEATSALDEVTQENLYSVLKQRLPATTVISAIHRQDPQKFHQVILDILPEQAQPA